MIVKKNKVQYRFEATTPPESPKRLSVISAVWSLRTSDPQNLPTLLKSLWETSKAGLTRGLEMEVIVVANSQEVYDYLLQNAKEPWAPQKFIQVPGGAGESRGYNIGRQLATGDLLLLTNDRIVYNPGGISQMIEALLQDPDCVGVAPNGSSFDHERFLRDREYFEKLIYYLDDFPKTRVDTAYGVCTLVKSRFFDAIGGFRITNGSPYCSPEISMAIKLFKYNYLHGTDYYYLAIPDLPLQDVGRYQTANQVKTGTAANAVTPFLGEKRPVNEFMAFEVKQFAQDMSREWASLSQKKPARKKSLLGSIARKFVRS